MTPAKWLRRQRTALRGPSPDTLARFAKTLEAVEQIKRDLGAIATLTAAIRPAPAEEPINSITVAVDNRDGRFTDAPATAVPRSVPLVVPVTLTDSLVRCGCWPRYVGGHYCSRRPS